MNVLSSNYTLPTTFFFFLRFVITLGVLACYINPAYAIPPPETLALLGGSIVYPGLLIIGVLTILFKYIWVKTRLYLVWRHSA